MWTPPERVRHPIPATAWPSRAQAASSRLFSPVSLGPLTLATRTWVPAMVPWRATAEGFASPDVIAWYRRFAAGRPGAIVIEATGIRDVPSGPLLRIGDDRFIPGLREIVAAVREASEGETKLLIQLIDFLALKRRPPPDKFFARFLRLDAGHRERLAAHLGDARWRDAPEAEVRERLAAGDDALHDAALTTREREDLRVGYRERVTDLHLEHIRELPRSLPPLFAAAASRAREAGFDGVELHYAHAYTMASFLSRTNTRADGYGGSREGRLRLPLEVLAAARAAVGADYALGCRFLGDEVIAGGSDLDDAAHFGRAFAQAGMDFLSVSKGGKFDDAKQPKVGEAVYPYTGRSGYECMPTVYSDARGPFARNLPLAARVRAELRDAGLEIPVVAAGGFNSFELAEAALARGEADVIAAARQSLADPDWWLKMRLGRGAEIRRCKFTNYCEALDTRHQQVTCQLWDRVELDAPDVPLSRDGRRRLLAPAWP
ncbi:NADH:flavin oxidoreductase [Pseudenhygromyxa sp. WMMC2535]|uniref:oxidoreductase n=1 Tax=Pseudenhygromyxa sp. WMMC2535 TaxID=2712867 RepID=UPI0015581CCA|nr:NADH:flavin oxidoreductase [Pseudenhygromyxa sp. WMMC2535]NVB36931.1 NADH:flavin oxidoreductase [Pseudenhygromyxa sp. WMMC2535]